MQGLKTDTALTDKATKVLMAAHGVSYIIMHYTGTSFALISFPF